METTFLVDGLRVRHIIFSFILSSKGPSRQRYDIFHNVILLILSTEEGRLLHEASSRFFIQQNERKDYVNATVHRYVDSALLWHKEVTGT